jgi:hypothetical protein
MRPSLDSQRLCDDLVPIGNPTPPNKHPVELLCACCLTVRQKYQVERSVAFPTEQQYRAAVTEDLRCGMREVVGLAKRLHGDLTECSSTSPAMTFSAFSRAKAHEQH